MADETSAREERAQRGVLPGECGASDGLSLCTEREGPGHPAIPGGGLLHWDRCTQHEWPGDEVT
jgi:hypothetical protein